MLLVNRPSQTGLSLVFLPVLAFPSRPILWLAFVRICYLICGYSESVSGLLLNIGASTPILDELLEPFSDPSFFSALSNQEAIFSLDDDDVETSPPSSLPSAESPLKTAAEDDDDDGLAKIEEGEGTNHFHLGIAAHMVIHFFRRTRDPQGSAGIAFQTIHRNPC